MSDLITIDANSAKIAVDIKGSAPGVGVQTGGRMANKLAILHLTRNAQPILARDPAATDTTTSAITITGEVRVRSETLRSSLESTDYLSLQGWDFRFLQFVILRELGAVYAGASSPAGATELNVWFPPAIPDKFFGEFCLDSFANETDYTGNKILPFINFDRPIVSPYPDGNLVVSNEMNDHPNQPLPLVVPNTLTGQRNFLFTASCAEEFVTVFVAVNTNKTTSTNPRGEITPLAHIGWRAVWKVRCTWAASQPLPLILGGSVFDHDKTFTIGAPDDAKLAAMIEHPPLAANEIANVVGAQAKDIIDKGHGSSFNLNPLGSWPSGVPSTFFT